MTATPRILRFCAAKPLIYNVCGQLISSDGFVHHRRRFEYHVLIAVTEGTLHITANGVQYAVSAGQYILLRADEEHFGHLPSAGRLSYMWVHFNERDLPCAPDGGAEIYPLPEYGNITHSEQVTLLFRQLTELSLEEGALSGEMPDYALSLLVMELSREYRQNTVSAASSLPPVVMSVADWIKANHYRPFTVSELADRYGYQADYLSSLFKKTVGVSIVRYANGLRIKSAKNLLLNYDLSIKEAAYSCGFSDEKYFMRIFKQYEGVTPTQYKNAFAKGDTHNEN